jgi:hypothetical protein
MTIAADTAASTTIRYAFENNLSSFAEARGDRWRGGAAPGFGNLSSRGSIASHTLPNNSRIAKIAGLIDRRQGRWSDAVRELERSAELDPRNLVPLDNLISTYFLMRSYGDVTQVIDRRAALKPNGIGTRLPRAYIDVVSRADTRALHAFLQERVTDDPRTAEYLAGPSFWLGVLERDPGTADRALALAARAKKTISATSNGDVEMSFFFWKGSVARMRGDALAAHAAFVRCPHRAGRSSANAT